MLHINFELIWWQVKYQVEKVCKDKFDLALPHQASVSVADVDEPDENTVYYPFLATVVALHFTTVSK